MLITNISHENTLVTYSNGLWRWKYAATYITYDHFAYTQIKCINKYINCSY